MKRRVVAIAAVLTGCGGGAGASAGDAAPVDGGERLTSLTPAQQAQVCNSTRTFVQVTSEDTCKSLALAAVAADAGLMTDAELQAACTSAYQECLSASPDGGQSSNCDFGAVDAGDCSATTAQFLTCLTDIETGYTQATGSLPSCATLTTQNVVTPPTLNVSVFDPPSCVAFSQACPGGTMTLVAAH